MKIFNTIAIVVVFIFAIAQQAQSVQEMRSVQVDINDFSIGMPMKEALTILRDKYCNTSRRGGIDPLQYDYRNDRAWIDLIDINNKISYKNHLNLDSIAKAIGIVTYDANAGSPIMYARFSFLDSKLIQFIVPISSSLVTNNTVTRITSEDIVRKLTQTYGGNVEIFYPYSGGKNIDKKNKINIFIGQGDNFDIHYTITDSAHHLIAYSIKNFNNIFFKRVEELRAKKENEKKQQLQDIKL